MQKEITNQKPFCVTAFQNIIFYFLILMRTGKLVIPQDGAEPFA